MRIAGGTGRLCACLGGLHTAPPPHTHTHEQVFHKRYDRPVNPLPFPPPTRARAHTQVLRCSKRYAHDWRECPFAHPTENARRRDPREHKYCSTACPDYKQGFCVRGDACPYAHGVFECWLHPSRYRTQLCKDGLACHRPVCFFAHTLPELRAPTFTWAPLPGGGGAPGMQGAAGGGQDEGPQSGGGGSARCSSGPSSGHDGGPMSDGMRGGGGRNGMQAYSPGPGSGGGAGYNGINSGSKMPGYSQGKWGRVWEG